MASGQDGFIVMPGEGRRLSLFGVQVTIIAPGGETAGAYGLWDVSLQPQMEKQPLHVHKKMDEALYVLEGEVAMQIGERTCSVAAGGYVLVPRDVPHSAWNPGSAVAKMLTIGSPGGWEKNIEGLAEEFPALGSTPDMVSLAQLLEKCDVAPS